MENLATNELIIYREQTNMYICITKCHHNSAFVWQYNEIRMKEKGLITWCWNSVSNGVSYVKQGIWALFSMSGWHLYLAIYSTKKLSLRSKMETIDSPISCQPAVVFHPLCVSWWHFTLVYIKINQWLALTIKQCLVAKEKKRFNELTSLNWLIADLVWFYRGLD